MKSTGNTIQENNNETLILGPSLYENVWLWYMTITQLLSDLSLTVPTNKYMECLFIATEDFYS